MFPRLNGSRKRVSAPHPYVPQALCSPVEIPVFPRVYVPQTLCSPSLCSPGSMFPIPMFPTLANLGTIGSGEHRHILYVPQALCFPSQCSPGPMFPIPIFPRPFVPHPYVPQALCSPGSMFPIPMFPILMFSKPVGTKIYLFPFPHTSQYPSLYDHHTKFLELSIKRAFLTFEL